MRNEKLHSILTNAPSSLFQSIKSNRKSSSDAIHELKVGDKTYIGDSVPDGFFESLSKLKTADYDELELKPSFESFSRIFIT